MSFSLAGAVGEFAHWVVILVVAALVVETVLVILQIRGFDVPTWVGAVVWSVVLVNLVILVIRSMLLDA